MNTDPGKRGNRPGKWGLKYLLQTRVTLPDATYPTPVERALRHHEALGTAGRSAKWEFWAYMRTGRQALRVSLSNAHSP